MDVRNFYIPSEIFKRAILGFTILLIIIAVKLALCYTQHSSLIVQACEALALIFTLLIMIFVYLESRDPVISFSVIPIPKQEADLTTLVIMKNHSSIDTSVWVNLNLKINGIKIEIGAPEYTGEKAWNLQAQQTIEGARFGIGEALKKNIGKDINEILVELHRGKTSCPTLTAEIEITHTAPLRRKIYKPVQKWHFDFKRRIWVFDV